FNRWIFLDIGFIYKSICLKVEIISFYKINLSVYKHIQCFSYDLTAWLQLLLTKIYDIFLQSLEVAQSYDLPMQIHTR
ncbi:hypothetical protein S83_006031, partial [Arachis hypogaea]